MFVHISYFPIGRILIDNARMLIATNNNIHKHV